MAISTRLCFVEENVRDVSGILVALYCYPCLQLGCQSNNCKSTTYVTLL